MRAHPVFSLAFLCLSTFLAGSAAAAPGNQAASAMQATTQQLQDIEGAYALDDGRRAWIFMRDNRLYVEIGRQQKELVPVEANRFASRDGAVSMLFKPDRRSQDDKIVLDYGAAFDQAAPLQLASAKRPGRGGAD